MSIYERRKNLSFYLTFILLFSANCVAQDASRFDLSTDEGVNAAREMFAGKKLAGNSRNCIKRPKELPGIILVGTFAHDRGCMPNGAFIKKHFISDKNALSKPALESLGWQRGRTSLPERKEAALRWVRFGILGFENPLEEPTATGDFAGREFQEPAVAAGGDGTISVTLWIRHRPGMRCQTVYEKLLFVFDGGGNLTGRKSLESFRIPCKRD